MGLVVITMFAPPGVVTAVAAAHGATLPAGAKMATAAAKCTRISAASAALAAPTGHLSATVAAIHSDIKKLSGSPVVSKAVAGKNWPWVSVHHAPHPPAVFAAM